jgi:hypothetical protein
MPAAGHATLRGGPVPNLFGQFGMLKAGDAQHDISTALVEWVENGSAPSAIVATKSRERRRSQAG